MQAVVSLLGFVFILQKIFAFSAGATTRRTRRLPKADRQFGVAELSHCALEWILPRLVTGLSMAGCQDQQSMPFRPYFIKLTAIF